MLPSLHFCIALGLSLAFSQIAQAKAILQGTVSFLNSGSRAAAGVKISAFGANECYTTDAGMFRLEFPDKKPGDKVKIIVGSNDRNGLSLELVNDKVITQVRIPSNPEEDIVEIIVCKAGQRNDAALRYNGLIVKNINETIEKRLHEIDEKLGVAKINSETITTLQKEKERLAIERDSALAKAEEQALYIASINLDKASQLVREAVLKVDSLQDIPGAITVLDNEILYRAYLEASEKKNKAEGDIQQVIDGFYFKIKLLEPQYRFSDIAECYEKIVEIYQKEGYDVEKIEGCLQCQVHFYLKSGQYKQALAFQLKIVENKEKSQNVNPLDLALSYCNLGRAFVGHGEYQKALECDNKVLAIREILLPANHPDLATSYSNLAFTYGKLREHKKSLEFNLKALAIREKVLPTDHLDLATSYNNLAVTYSNLDEYKKSLEFNLKALAIREKVQPADHPDLATSYANIAFTYGKLDEHKKELEFDLKALAIRKKVLPADHPDLALSYSNLAVTYSNLGEHQKELEFDLKALAIREKVLPTNHPNLVTSYNNLATIYGNLGEYQKELEFNLKALVISEKILRADHPDLATSYNNLATIYGNLGEYQKELEFNLKALVISEKILRADHPDLATSYNNLALNYGNLGEYQMQLKFNLKALAIREKILPADHSVLSISYANLGRAYRDVGEYEKGIEYGQKAIRIGETSNPKHKYLNRYYANLGITYVKAHQYPEAKTALEKSESLKAEERVYRGWAMYYALQNDKARALENLQKAVSLGYKDLKWIETDDSLESIRGEQGYKDLAEQLQKQ